MKAGLLCAVGVSIWTVVVACGQVAAPAELPSALRDHLKSERFHVVTSLRGLPLGVRNALETLFGTLSLDIAEPGTPIQMPRAVVDPTLKIRRLAVAGCSVDHCLVYYERGGTTHTWHLALFHWTPAETRFETGGTAPTGLATVDDLLHALVTGAIRTNKVW